MIEKFWTSAQLSKLRELKEIYHIPNEIMREIQKVIEILDTYYGSDRDIDNDDGGYVLLIFPDSIEAWKAEYPKLLKKYHLKEECAEFSDVVYEDEGIQWYSKLFLVSNDYGITLVYPLKKGDSQ